MWIDFKKALTTKPRLLFLFFLAAVLTSCLPSSQSHILHTSGIKPYWLRNPLPNTITVMGESTDSAEAVQNACYQARSQLIEDILKKHKNKINDSLRSQTDIQYHYRNFLMEQTERNQFSGIQISGIQIDSALIQDSYIEIRRDKSRGRNFYRHYLNLKWMDNWTDSLVNVFYAYDQEISEIINTASYYLDKPTDLGMIAFQIDRLSTLSSKVEDYRLQRANGLIAAYREMYDRIELKAVNVTPTSFYLMLLLGDRHLSGGTYDSLPESCVEVRLLRETDAGFFFAYDDAYCQAAAYYPINIQIDLPNHGAKHINLQLPGNRVVMNAIGPLILHYFEESKDGYAELYMQSITGQQYFVRNLHFNGLDLNMAMNGRGRTIKGSGKYQLRAPIAQDDFLKLLKSKPKIASGGLIYTHPTSGIEIDNCFEGIEIEIIRH